MKPIMYSLAGHPLSYFQGQLSLQLSSIVCSVNSIYWSSVAVMVLSWPYPGRRLIFPVSWNRFRSLETILLTTPTASGTLRCVFPDSSLFIARHATNSGKSCCWDIFKSSFLKNNNWEIEIHSSGSETDFSATSPFLPLCSLSGFWCHEILICIQSFLLLFPARP